MKSAKVSELKASLSRYLARVKRGEEVLVTERGRPVAKLVPIIPSDDDEMARLRDMERRGLLKVGTGRLPEDFWQWDRPKVPDGWIQDWIEWERGEGAR